MESVPNKPIREMRAGDEVEIVEGKSGPSVLGAGSTTPKRGGHQQ